MGGGKEGEGRQELTLRAQGAVIVGIQEEGSIGGCRPVSGLQSEHDVS